MKRLVQLHPDASVSLAHGGDLAVFPRFLRNTNLIHRIGPRRGALQQIRFTLAACRWLLKHAREYDVVFGVDTFETTVIPLVLAKALGCRIYLKQASTASGLPPTNARLWVVSRQGIRKRCLQACNGVVAISGRIEQQLCAAGIQRERIVRISNGVDVGRFSPVCDSEKTRLRAQLGLPKAQDLLLVVAQMRRIKRVHWAIEASLRLRQSDYPLGVVIVGSEHLKDRSYASELRSLASELGELCHFVGQVDDPAPYYQASDYFALTSEYEGMPNALLEAMSAGLACFSTRVSGAEDLIVHGRNGCFVTNSGEIEQAILRLRQGGRKEMGALARATIQSGYDDSTVAESYYQLFTSCRACRPREEG